MSARRECSNASSVQVKPEGLEILKRIRSQNQVITVETHTYIWSSKLDRGEHSVLRAHPCIDHLDHRKKAIVHRSPQHQSCVDGHK